jgi:transposase
MGIVASTAISRLRTIRDAQRRAEALLVERDALIKKAVAEGHSERLVAEAAGLSAGRINQITHSG